MKPGHAILIGFVGYFAGALISSALTNYLNLKPLGT